MLGPDSSYSALLIHICWKVDSEARIEPPIHTLYLRSGGATTLIFMVLGASAVSSLVMRSPMPVVVSKIVYKAAENTVSSVFVRIVTSTEDTCAAFVA
jgi:hypothetical protein